MRLSLPSELQRQPDDDWLVLAQPSPEHRTRSAESMTALASAASTPSPSVEPVDVVISHVDHQGFLSPHLYLFHLHALDDEGLAVDSLGELRRLHIAAVLNQPVARQVESMLSMLSQVAQRHLRHADLMEHQTEHGKIDIELAKVDEEASNAVVDVLRHGWRAAAAMVARNAAEIGMPLRVTYEPDPFPALDHTARRTPALRRAYNELELVRDAIDRVVALAAGGGMIVADSNTPERLRGFAQQHFELSSASQYFAQALRDGFALGNGYVTFTDAEPIGAYNLRPELTVLGPEEGGAYLDGGATRVPVAHFKGVEQATSPYGVSLLEVILPILFQVDAFTEAAAFARQILAEDQEEGRLWAQRTVPQADRVLAAAADRIGEILAPLLQLPPPSSSGLYFAGSELL